MATEAEVIYPMWRWHLWHSDFGSYEDIESAVASGALKVFTCPKADCDCKWPKVPLTENHTEPLPLKWDIINSTMRIAKGQIERGADPVDVLGAALLMIYEAGYAAGATTLATAQE